MIMALKPQPNRTLCSCREAAEILGCTMGRVRQLCRKPERGGPPLLWSQKFGARALVLDLDEVKRLAKVRRKARDSGLTPGPAPGGFQPDT
jgi:transposase